MNKFFRQNLVFFGILFFILLSGKIGDTKSVLIYAPATPSSVPLIMAVENLPGVQVKIFTNHSQAHSLFVKGEVPMLSTGLSVGVGFFRQGVPVKIVNSYVSGLSYLVTDRPVKNFQELKGIKVYLPFTGSPIEEVTKFFIFAEGLTWNQDIPIGYAMFPGAVNMLQHGLISAAVLPEPFVSLVLGNKGCGSISQDSLRSKNIHIAFSYKSLWEKYTGDTNGYPQVGTFVHREWAKSNASTISQLNKALAQAICSIAQAPDQAVKKAALYMDFSTDVLTTALERTDFNLLQNDDLYRKIKKYYQTLGAPLDETFEDFF